MSAYLRIAASEKGGAAGQIARFDEEGGVAVLADGTGGAAGEAMARAAVEPALKTLLAEGSVEKAFASAHQAACTQSEDEGAGASFIAAQIDRTGTLVVGHLGNVRVYIARKTNRRRGLPKPPAPLFCPPVQVGSVKPIETAMSMVCLSRDHSAVCDMVEGGHLSAEDGRKHPLRGRVSKGLRAGPLTPPTVTHMRLFPDDRVLLCSDGLWDAVSDRDMLAALAEHHFADDACEALAERAGSKCSFAAVVIDCFPDRERDEARRNLQRGHKAQRKKRASKKSGREKQKRPSSERPRSEQPRSNKRRSSEPPKNGDIIRRMGRNLTALAIAGKLDPVIGRKREVQQLAQALVARRKANAVLIGPPGVGKTAIVEGLALQMATGGLGDRFADKRIVEMSMGALVAGTKYRGQFEERLQEVIRIAEDDPELVIFMDELHTAMGAGATSGSATDAADLLKPALSRGSMRLIGATTTEEYQKYIARDAAFERRFIVIDVKEPSVGHTIEILQGLRPSFEKHYQVQIVDEAFEAAATLSKRYIPGRYLPDKAIDLIDRACARLLVPLTPTPGDGSTLRRDHIVKLVADMCDVDIELIGRDVREARERVGELLSYLTARLFGQDAAMGVVARQLKRAYGGLKDPKRPIASFLFAGPTGVGKTETAKVVSEFLFGDRDRVLRIDMSEYESRWAVSRLIGAPPGYIGHDEEGQLTGPMLRQGARVVLFDEIEKAHPDVLLVLLQILDEGRLTDSHGRVASFHEAVIVMTSNLLQSGPVARKAKQLGFALPKKGAQSEEAEEQVEDDSAARSELAKQLRPELVGRIGAVVTFSSLSPEAAKAIVNKCCNSALQRLQAQGVALQLPDGFQQRVLERLGDLRFGARMVERLVDEEVGKLLDRSQPSAGRSDASMGASMHASMRGSARNDVAMLALELPEGVDADEAKLHALVAKVCIGAQAAQVRHVDACEGRVVVLAATLRAALAIARRHDSLDGKGLRRLVHRGRVQLDEQGNPRGVGLHVLEMLRGVLAEHRETAGQLVLSSAAHEALDADARAGFVPLESETLRAMGSDISLWTDAGRTA